MAMKKGFFQKADRKKQYSDNVLNNVESAYRPKKRGRVKNPISSNTMSGEEPDTLDEDLREQNQDRTQERLRNPVGYSFVGPQAKRQKSQIEAEASDAEHYECDEEAPPVVVFAAPPGFEQFARPAESETQSSGKSKFSQPEIQVFTGNIVREPAIDLELESVCEPLSTDEILEAMKVLEIDVQESRGNYDPIQESELQRLADLGLRFEPENYRKDTKKTQFLNRPAQGIKRSNRGTIEAVFQPDGKVIEAQYNRCGILIEVCVAGAMKLTRSAETGKWSMSCSDGSQPVNSITNVSFDRLGNLCYSTQDGRQTVICADGRVVEK